MANQTKLINIFLYLSADMAVTTAQIGRAPKTVGMERVRLVMWTGKQEETHP